MLEANGSFHDHDRASSSACARKTCVKKRGGDSRIDCIRRRDDGLGVIRFQYPEYPPIKLPRCLAGSDRARHRLLLRRPDKAVARDVRGKDPRSHPPALPLAVRGQRHHQPVSISSSSPGLPSATGTVGATSQTPAPRRQSGAAAPPRRAAGAACAPCSAARATCPSLPARARRRPKLLRADVPCPVAARPASSSAARR
jgi:hypothetical protein